MKLRNLTSFVLFSSAGLHPPLTRSEAIIVNSLPSPLTEQCSHSTNLSKRMKTLNKSNVITIQSHQSTKTPSTDTNSILSSSSVRQHRTDASALWSHTIFFLQPPPTRFIIRAKALTSRNNSLGFCTDENENRVAKTLFFTKKRANCYQSLRLFSNVNLARNSRKIIF